MKLRATCNWIRKYAICMRLYLDDPRNYLMSQNELSMMLYQRLCVSGKCFQMNDICLVDLFGWMDFLVIDDFSFFSCWSVYLSVHEIRQHCCDCSTIRIREIIGITSLRLCFCDICRHKSSSNCIPSHSCHLRKHKKRINKLSISRLGYRIFSTNFLFSLGYLVTSVVERLMGRCIARRRASNGTNSTPPDIIHVLAFEWWQFWFPLRGDAKLDTPSPGTFSLRHSRCTDGRTGGGWYWLYFALQSQKQLAQHCDGINGGAISDMCGFVCFLYGDSSSSSGGPTFGQESTSKVFIRVLSVQPYQK